MRVKRGVDVGPAGLTADQERDLRIALERLREVNRPAYLGGIERYNLDQAIKAIEARLNPPAVSQLLANAERVSTPLEHLLTDIDRQVASEAVCEAIG